MTDIRWPVEHRVAGADIHAVNRAVSTASPGQVWQWIVLPDRWSEIYPNAHRVRHLAGPWPEISLGSRFSWITLGAPVTTTVTECEPCERLAWSGTGPGARGHHAWLLQPVAGGGCEILTEETQRGLPVRVLRPVLRPAMQRMHQRWVDALAVTAPQRSPA